MISQLQFNYLPHVKRGSIQEFTNELPPYARNVKICIMKLVASDVIISRMVVPEVSLTQLLTARAAILQTKG
jgi:hypothetical protein